MPYKSKQQQKYFHAVLPEHAPKWDQETKQAGGFSKLPKKAKKKKVTSTKKRKANARQKSPKTSR